MIFMQWVAPPSMFHIPQCPTVEACNKLSDGMKNIEYELLACGVMVIVLCAAAVLMFKFREWREKRRNFGKLG